MDKKDIKVSIVVAIYKSEKFLDKLIKSIINQTHKNIEVILVDDGSPDNSGAVCDKYASQDSRIQVLHKKNGGACDARNKGMELVTGEYLSIIDGDDWLEPDYIEYLLGMCVDTDSDMSMCKNIFTTRDRVQVTDDHIEVLTPEEAAVQIIYPKIPIGPWAKLYKTSLIKDNHIDLFLNEYSTYDKGEVARVLKPGGILVLNQNGSENLKEFLNMYMPLALRSQWNIETAKQSLINAGFTILEAYEDYGYLHFRNLNQLDTYLKKVVPELIQEREKFLQFYTQALRDMKNQGFYSLSTYRFIIIAKLTGSYQEIA